MPPPARVMVMREFRTVAGRATFVSRPRPRASKPTQATAQSTSRTPRICLLRSARESVLPRLPATPPALMDVPVGSAGPGGFHVKTMAGLAFFALAAAAAGDVERAGHQVAHADIFDVAPRLDHFASDLVSENEARRSRSSA